MQPFDKFTLVAGTTGLALVCALATCSFPSHAQSVPTWLSKNDKAVHAIASAGLAAGALELQRRGHGPEFCKGSERVCAFGAVMVLGTIKESLPRPYNERFDMKDMAANAAGALAGVYVHGLIVTPRSITYTTEF